MSRSSRRTTILLVVSTVVVASVLALVDLALRPDGILPFEFAGPEAGAAMARRWSSKGVSYLAAFSLGLDYLYMPLYAETLARFAGDSWRRHVPWAAAGFDAVENAALLAVLGGSSGWATIAVVAASVKFALLLGSVVSSLAVWIRRRRS